MDDARDLDASLVVGHQQQQVVLVAAKPPRKPRKSKVSCATCGTPLKDGIIIHDELKIGLCPQCGKAIAEEPVTVNTQGTHEKCTLCRLGGNLLWCSNCPRGMCAVCIKRNLGDGELKRTEGDVNWVCYVCDPKPLEGLQRAAEEFSHSLSSSKRSSTGSAVGSDGDSPTKIKKAKKQKKPTMRLAELACEQCGKEYTTTLGLSYHMKTKHTDHRETFVCATCSKEFLSEGGLQYHQPRCGLKGEGDKTLLDKAVAKAKRSKKRKDVEDDEHALDDPKGSDNEPDFSPDGDEGRLV